MQAAAKGTASALKTAADKSYDATLSKRTRCVARSAASIASGPPSSPAHHCACPARHHRQRTLRFAAVLSIPVVAMVLLMVGMIEGSTYMIRNRDSINSLADDIGGHFTVGAGVHQGLSPRVAAESSSQSLKVLFYQIC